MGTKVPTYAKKNWSNPLNHLIRLGVNIDHVATLRQARLTRFPDPVYAASLAEQAGADGITLHLREDRRHIQERDVWILKETLLTPMNFEMAVTETMLDFVSQIQPAHACFVPEKREELTTEGGLDVAGHFSKVSAACEQLASQGIEVSLFIDPDEKQIDAAKRCNAPVIEIHTGAYADATSVAAQQAELIKITKATAYAHQLGIQVNAGHGLNYQNVGPIAAIPEMVELNIGHAIVAHAIFVGFETAVREMKRLMLQARYSITA